MYVLDAHAKGLKANVKKLHSEEAPISLLASIIANSNRDQKKKREPYKMEDFFLYQTKEDMNIPSSVFGSAAMELVKTRQMPQWALFVYKDLKMSADGRTPQLLAFIGEDIMLLAPVIDEREVRGMVVAQESAFGKFRHLKSPCGQSIKIIVPRYSGKYYAEENVTMQLL